MYTFQTCTPVVVDGVTPMRTADPATAIGVDLAVSLEVDSLVDVYFNPHWFRINDSNTT